jgi:DNA-directed RNA polymerase subunit RPC12/RpoP
MPYYHCVNCSHEFESPKRYRVKCDWCGSREILVLEEKTPLEKMCENIPELLEKLKSLKEKWRKEENV